MNFLRQHFEKLILGVVLAALVAGIVSVLLSIGKGKDAVSEQKATAESALKTGKELVADQARDLTKATEALISPKNSFDFIAAAGDPKGSLVEPVHYLRCVNPRCAYLIPHDERVCRFCNTEEPPEKKDIYPVEEDQDRDSIPNYVEKNTPFLRYDNPADAGEDYDQDTFTNLEEYRNGTNMALPTSFPSLALNLRLYEKPFNPQLPLLLRSMQTNNSDDPKQWALVFSLFNARSQRFISRTFRVGDSVGRLSDGRKAYGPFTITAVARERRKVGEEVKEVGVVTLTWEDKTYTLVEGEKAYDPELSASLIYLASRYKKYEDNLKRQYRVAGQKDELFQLVHLGTQRREVYKIVSVAEDKVVVELVQGGAGAGMDGGMGGGMGGGMDGGMGGGMGEGGGMMGPGMMGPGMDQGGGAEFGGGNGMARGATAPAPEPIIFEITRQFDPKVDLIDVPRPTRATPGTLIQPQPR